MRTAIVLAVIAIGLAVFGWWGVYTTAGNRRFDEMDGLIPLFAGVIAVVVFAVAMLLAVLAWRAAGRQPRV